MPVLAGAGGYNTQGSHPPRRRDAQGRRRRPAVGDAVLQQADAGRALPALPGHRRQHAAADRASTTCRAAPACNIEPPTLVRLAAIPNIVGVKEASGNITQMCDVCRVGAGRLHRAVGRRCDDAAADGGRRARRDLGGVERDSRRRWSQMVEAAERGDFAAARAIHTRIMPLMQVNFVEANPGAGEGGDGGDGPARRESTGCRCVRRGPSRRNRSSRC